MKIVDFVSIVIMAPAMLYGLVTQYYLIAGIFYLIFRRISLKNFKEAFKDMRLSDSFIAKTKKLFWFTYTPLFAIVIIFRFATPIYAEKNSGLVFAIICYLLMLLFSGYISLKKNKD